MMNYVLWNDNCSDCQFVANAFTLLRLPISSITHTEIIEENTPLLSASVLFICKNSKANHKKKISDLAIQENICLIILDTTNKPNATPSIKFLKTPFCAYNLKDLLLSCYDQLTHSNIIEDENCLSFNKLIGQSTAIKQVKSMIQQVAFSDSTVLIQGLSGTGKDVIANCIHTLSNRRKYPFIPINCGAIPAELIESELFGHEKGAFTGAFARRIGRFEMAQGGTLFLDEIGDMPFSMQVKLLRVLQDRKIERIGGTAGIDVDVRIIAATNKNIESLIENNKFREDLFYRLNVFPIFVPSLHERSDDIPILIDYHLQKIYERIQHQTYFTENAKRRLCEYAWPGNIRELQNFLERMVILHPDKVVDEKHLPEFLQPKISLKIDLNKCDVEATDKSPSTTVQA
jgi:sigma-54 specific flagellar transcriptional regulator A